MAKIPGGGVMWESVRSRRTEAARRWETVLGVNPNQPARQGDGLHLESFGSFLKFELVVNVVVR